MVDYNAVQDLVNAIKEQPEDAGTTYSAVVSRIDNEGVAWVYLEGSQKETPISSAASEIKRGDRVNVEWRNNKLYIAGNYSNPSAGVGRVEIVERLANEAVQDAGRARAAADIAEESAADAKATADSVHDIAVQASDDAAEAKSSATAASSAAAAAASAAATADAKAVAAGNAAGAAQTAAGNAQQSADSALVSLATAQDVVGVLNWITAHGTMTTQSGGVFVPGQVYFVLDDATPGDYHVGNHYYSVVPEPKAADIDSYYILTVDESVQNYVATHIVVDAEGLWIIPDAGGNKVLIATGSGSTYTTAGTYIVGKVNGVDTVFAKFLSSGTTIQAESGTVIAHLGYGPGKNSGGGTSDAPYYTLGTRAGNIGNYSVAEGSNSTASGYSSHAEGGSRATGVCAHAEGDYSKAAGDSSHAEGNITEANGHYSHSEGNRTTASGQSSHAEGSFSESSGTGSHAQNLFTKASKDGQTALGTYNVEDTSSTTTHPSGASVYGKYAAIIGNGTADNARSNALTVDWSGNVEAAGDVEDGNGNTISALKARIDALATLESYKPTWASTTGCADCWVSRCGCIGQIYILNINKLAKGSNIAFTLPDGWRPNVDIVQVPSIPNATISNGSTQLSLRIIVHQNGQVEIYNYRSAAITSGTNASITFSYIISRTI